MSGVYPTIFTNSSLAQYPRYTQYDTIKISAIGKGVKPYIRRTVRGCKFNCVLSRIMLFPTYKRFVAIQPEYTINGTRPMASIRKLVARCCLNNICFLATCTGKGYKYTGRILSITIIVTASFSRNLNSKLFAF